MFIIMEDMKRDYTYIDDLVNAINLLIPIVPDINGKRISKNDPFHQLVHLE